MWCDGLSWCHPFVGASSCELLVGSQLMCCLVAVATPLLTECRACRQSNLFRLHLECWHSLGLWRATLSLLRGGKCDRQRLILTCRCSRLGVALVWLAMLAPVTALHDHCICCIVKTQYIKDGPDPIGVAVMMEDGAAVIGVGIAAASLGLTWWTGNIMFDAIGTSQNVCWSVCGDARS